MKLKHRQLVIIVLLSLVVTYCLNGIISGALVDDGTVTHVKEELTSQGFIIEARDSYSSQSSPNEVFKVSSTQDLLRAARLFNQTKVYFELDMGTAVFTMDAVRCTNQTLVAKVLGQCSTEWVSEVRLVVDQPHFWPVMLETTIGTLSAMGLIFLCYGFVASYRKNKLGAEGR